MDNIKIINFTITGISLTQTTLNISYRLGSISKGIKISLNNCYFFPTADSIGLIHDITILDAKYSLFIMSTELSNILSHHNIRNKPYCDSLSRGWMVEIIKTFENYRIYFLRSFETETVFDNRASNDSLVKWFYHSDPSNKSDIRKYMLLRFKSGHSVLVQIDNYNVKCHNFNYHIETLIGKFKYSQIDAFAYVIHLDDLRKIQSKNGFKELIYFQFEGYLLPIPCLPQISNFDYKRYGNPNSQPLNSVSRINAYTSFISRSQVLTIFIKTDTTIENINNDLSFEDNNQEGLLKLREAYSDYTYSNYIKFGKKDPQNPPPPNSIFLTWEDSYDLGFFNEVADYDSYLDDIEAERAEILNNDYFPSWEDQIWGDLDWDEKFGMNPDRALSDFESVSSDFSMPSFSDEDELKPDIKTDKTISRIFCTVVSDKCAVFEIIREEHYQRVVTPIKVNPFIEGLMVYSGVMKYSGIGDIQFSIIEKCPIEFLEQFLRSVMGYTKFQVRTSYNYYICFNTERNSNFLIFEDIFKNVSIKPRVANSEDSSAEEF